MKARVFWRSFWVSAIFFAAIAFLVVGFFGAYIGTRTIGFDSHTSLFELCDLHTVRFMDWYFETDMFAFIINLVIKILPVG